MISKRLEACATYTKGYDLLADIGTDHAFVPIFCIESGYVKKALAIDNKKGPLEIAKTNIEKHNLQNKINPILSDGLTNVKADVVIIAGMGGILITKILEKKENLNNARLILAPNNDTYLLRTWALLNQYKITAEEIIFENNHYYEIIILDPGKMELTKSEIIFGINRTKNYYDMLKAKLNAINSIKEQYQDKEIKKLIEEILNID